MSPLLSASLLTVLGFVQANEPLFEVEGAALGTANAIRLTINVDNFYGLHWNGEFLGSLDVGWPQTTHYTLIPVAECGYPNILAINATGDLAVNDAILVEARYGSKLYQGGVSPDILVAPGSSITDPAWFSKSNSDESLWSASSVQPACRGENSQPLIPPRYYSAGTRWFWYGSCSALKHKTVYVKLVIPTVCDSKKRANALRYVGDWLNGFGMGQQ